MIFNIINSYYIVKARYKYPIPNVHTYFIVSYISSIVSLVINIPWDTKFKVITLTYFMMYWHIMRKKDIKQM